MIKLDRLPTSPGLVYISRRTKNGWLSPFIAEAIASNGTLKGVILRRPGL